MEPPKKLKTIQSIQKSLLMREVYAIDPDGNVWICTDDPWKLGKWRMYRQAKIS
jgi:hypothetical protein